MKYELIKDDTIEADGETLYRIKALEKIRNTDANGNLHVIKIGDLGGYIADEYNLSHEGNCWVADNAKVYGRATVTGGTFVSGNASISGLSIIGGNTKISDNAKIYDKYDPFLKIITGCILSSDADIAGDVDYVVLTGFGDKDCSFTVYRTGNGFKIACRDFCVNLNDFEDYIYENIDKDYHEEYLAMLNLVKIHFKKLKEFHKYD